MKTKIFKTLFVFILVANVGFIYSQNTYSNSVTKDEAIEFWTNFKSFCRQKEVDKIDKFIETSVLYQKMYFGEIESQNSFTIKEVKKIFSETVRSVDIVPVWTEKMDSVTIGKSVNQNFGESGSLYWVYDVSRDNPNEYIYINGKSGPVSYQNIYFFRKSEGIIKLYKVISEEL